jgi:serpin B
MLRKLLIVGLLLVVLGGTVQAQEPTPTSTSIPTPPPPDFSPLVVSNNTFAFDLYRAIQVGPENIIFSPYSISSALAMLYAGAQGITQQEMAATLRFDLSQDQVAQGFNWLNQTLPVGAPRVEWEYKLETQLNVANALLVLDEYPIRTDYAALLEQYYGAGLHAMDFVNAPEESRQSINGWVSEHTQDRIQDLLPENSITSWIRFVLTNAIYFNAGWETPFQVEATKDDIFTLLDGSQVTVPMMEDTSLFAFYARGDEYQVVQLPYQDRGSMVIILPDSGQFEARKARKLHLSREIGVTPLDSNRG